MYICRECKYGEINNKYDEELTSEERQIIEDNCLSCPIWDEFDEEWIASNFTEK